MRRSTRTLTAVIAATAVGMLHSPQVAAASSPTTVRVSVSSSGAQANGRSLVDAVSPDGRLILFDSWASNLVASDTNGVRDVFLRDRKLGRTTRVSVGPGGRQANGPSRGISISSDGRFVLFDSQATNVSNQPDRNGNVDVFVRNRLRGKTFRVSVRPGGGQFDDWVSGAGISDNGRWVAFGESPTPYNEACFDDDREVYIRDRTLHRTHRVGRCMGAPVALSSDGQWLVIDQGIRSPFGMVLRDLTTGRMHRISGGATTFGGLTAHAHYLAYEEYTGPLDLVRWNRITGRRLLIHHDEAAPIDGCQPVGITSSGSVVTCVSKDPNLVRGDTNHRPDLFSIDLKTKAISRIDLTRSGGQIQRGITRRRLAFGTYLPTAVMSSDGHWAAFASADSAIVPGDTNHVADVFLRGQLN